MTIEELNSVKRIREEIRRKNQELELLNEISAPVSAMDGQPRAKPVTSIPEKILLAIEEAEAMITTLTNDLIDVTARLTSEIYSVFADAPLTASVLVRHYCAGQSFAEIASDLGYTKNYMLKLNSSAMKRLKA